MRYGIDIDGVLADFVKGFASLGETFKGTHREWKLNLDSWGLGLTRAQEQEGWKLVTANPTFWLDLEVLNRFPQERLAPMDVVYFITKRKETPGRSTAQDAAKWLRDKQGVELPTVLALNNKGETCRTLAVNAFIDDKPENCWDVMEKSPTTLTCLMDQPWNQWDTKIPRVYTLEEFFDRAQG